VGCIDTYKLELFARLPSQTTTVVCITEDRSVLSKRTQRVEKTGDSRNVGNFEENSV
jgi:hypothetical protein